MDLLQISGDEAKTENSSLEINYRVILDFESEPDKLVTQCKYHFAQRLFHM